MADVADGRFWADAGAGPSFHCAGERTGPRVWPEALYGGDTPALRRAGSPPRDPRIRRRRAIGRRLCDPRLGVAARAPQGVVCGFPPCRPLVRRADGAARRQARHGREVGLSFCLPLPAPFFSLAPLLRGASWGEGLFPIRECRESIEPGTPPP